MTTVFVTNKWDKPLIDDYAYKEYVFPVGETVELSAEAAGYIFGHGREDKMPCLTRLGWARTLNDIPHGLAILERFEISVERPTKVHSLSPVVRQVPLPSSKRGGGKSESLQAQNG